MDELVGYDLVAGDDDWVEVSGPGSRKVKASRVYALHLGLQTVAAGASTVLQSTPSKPFRPDRISVKGTVVTTGVDGDGLVRVGNIQAGNVTLTIGQGARVHGSHYEPRAVSTRLVGETVAPGVACSVDVALDAAAAASQQISAAMFGLSTQ